VQPCFHSAILLENFTFVLWEERESISSSVNLFATIIVTFLLILFTEDNVTGYNVPYLFA
jgi:hypothetical protein